MHPQLADAIRLLVELLAKSRIQGRDAGRQPIEIDLRLGIARRIRRAGGTRQFPELAGAYDETPLRQGEGIARFLERGACGLGEGRLCLRLLELALEPQRRAIGTEIGDLRQTGRHQTSAFGFESVRDLVHLGDPPSQLVALAAALEQILDRIEIGLRVARARRQRERDIRELGSPRAAPTLDLGGSLLAAADGPLDLVFGLLARLCLVPLSFAFGQPPRAFALGALDPDVETLIRAHAPNFAGGQQFNNHLKCSQTARLQPRQLLVELATAAEQLEELVDPSAPFEARLRHTRRPQHSGPERLPGRLEIASVPLETPLVVFDLGQRLLESRQPGDERRTGGHALGLAPQSIGQLVGTAHPCLEAPAPIVHLEVRSGVGETRVRSEQPLPQALPELVARPPLSHKLGFARQAPHPTKAAELLADRKLLLHQREPALAQPRRRFGPLGEAAHMECDR